MLARRIQKEYETIIKDINSNSLEGINISLYNENDLYHFKASIKGKKGTPYEGGTFQIHINMPSDYPFKPMNIRFLTKIFHPCIDRFGTICRCCFLPEICESWSPAYTLEKILFILRERLYDENNNYEFCYKNKYLKLLKLNRRKYNEITREYTKYYAMENHGDIDESVESIFGTPNLQNKNTITYEAKTFGLYTFEFCFDANNLLVNYSCTYKF